jgi:peroxiredoxin
VIRKSLLPLLVIFLMGLLMAGCGQKSEAEGRAGGQGLVVGSRTGDLAPDFSLQRIDGGTLDLASLKGKAVLIDFWDTWCPPCRRAMPHLQEISEAYAGDLVVIGVAMGRDGEEKVRSYVKNNGLTFEFVLADAPNYTVLRDYGGVQSIPTTFLVDRQGVIRNVWTGALPKAEYEKAVRSVLGV